MAALIALKADMPAGLADLADRAEQLAEAARAENTKRAYRADWRHFAAWCETHGLAVLPAEPTTVGLYVTDHGDRLALATLGRRLAAIATVHRMAGYAFDCRHPAVADVMAGLRRSRGTAQRRVEALTVVRLRRLLSEIGDRRIDRRDRALMLVGFGAALRRSELVALDVADISVEPEGLRVTIRRSKTDQDGAGATLAVGRTGSATCPVAAYEAWIDEAGITEGAVFRGIDRHDRIAGRLSTNAVAEIVKRRVAAAGLDPAGFAGHSLRAGFATSAARAGIGELTIARQTRHASLTVLRRYVRDGGLFERNFPAEIGL